MFKKNLQSRLETIFGVKKVTFNAPDYEAPEQDCLFVEINETNSRMSAGNGGRATAKVKGEIIAFSQGTRTPFGFFAKAIEKAPPSAKSAFFFEPEIDVPNSPARIQDIHERRVPFLFLYDAQYDPDRGTLTSMTVE